jgi:hypothetical protein
MSKDGLHGLRAGGSRCAARLVGAYEQAAIVIVPLREDLIRGFTTMIRDPDEFFELIDTLLDDDKWPTYTNSTVLQELDKLASQAFKRDTFDGYLSYVLISHQVCEDYILLLLRHAQLTLRMHVVLSGFGWPTEKYEAPGVGMRTMFGRILELLDNSINFEHKKEFIEACHKQNAIRNQLAHRLLDGGGITLGQIRSIAQTYEGGDRAVVDSFNKADEDFCWFYFMQRMDPRWDHAIGEQIDRAKNESDRRRWEELRKRFRHTFTEQWKRRPESWRERNPLPDWL